MYNVLIVEDDPMARKLLEIFVATSDQYHLVPSLDSAAMAELYCMTNQVDLILMDVCTAMDANGIEAAEKLKKLYPQVKIIIITSQSTATSPTPARSAWKASGTRSPPLMPF